jgi:hypothetical protein
MSMVCNILNYHVRSCTSEQNHIIIALGSLLESIRNGNIDKCMQMMHLWIHEDPRRFEGLSRRVN